MISRSKWDKVIDELYDEVVKQMEENDKKMRLEYKFYEKNLAPKWLEGDYNLHIEGNKMTLTSKDNIKVSTRCHPEDDWRLQIGLDELKDRMNEKKKPREIKVGDKVRLLPTRANVWTVKYIDKVRKVALVDNNAVDNPYVVQLSKLELIEN